MPQVRMFLVGLVLSAPAFGMTETPSPPQAGATSGTVLVTDVGYTESSSSLRVEVQMNGPSTFTRGDVGNPPRAFVDIANARVGAGLHNKVVPVGSVALERIRIAQYDPDTVRVVLDLTPASAVSTFRLLEHPDRLVVDVVSLVKDTDATAVGESAVTEPASPTPAVHTASRAGTIPSLDIGSVGGRVSIHAYDVSLADLFRELDSVAGTESIIAPGMESYRVDAWVDGLPVDQAVGKLFEGRPVDYGVVGRRIVVFGMSEEGAPFTVIPARPAVPAAREVPAGPAVPAQPDGGICRLPQGGPYAVGATPAFEDAYYLCASVFVEEGEPARTVWVLMESSGAGLSIPTPPAPGDPCTLPGPLSYPLGAVVQQNGAIYRCVPVLDDNLDPAGTAWVTNTPPGN